MRSQIFVIIALLASTISMRPRAKKMISMRSLRQQGQPKIAGGEEAPLHGFPYQVAIYSKSVKVWYNGALITKSWVLTNAYVAYHALDPDYMYAKLGAQFVNQTEFSQQEIRINEKLIHETYDGEVKSHVDNIALLHLETAAKFDPYVATVMIAPFNAPEFKNSRLVMSSYGATTINGNPSGSLRYVVVNGISNRHCKKVRPGSVNEGTICAETTGKKGGCRHDAGAPLVDMETGLLVGVLALEDGCLDVPKPNVFTRISHYNKWIANSIDLEGC